MIDPTPQLSRDYSKLIEREGPSQDEIDYEAIQVMRGMDDDEFFYAVRDSFDKIKALIINCDPVGAGFLLQAEMEDYCRRIAERNLNV